MPGLASDRQKTDAASISFGTPKVPLTPTTQTRFLLCKPQESTV
jgi:hypothetical protein